MESPSYEAGDRVSINLSGVYLAICGACGSAELVVPGGRCVRCSAPEGALIAEPDLLNGRDAVRRDEDGVSPLDDHAELDLDQPTWIDPRDDSSDPDSASERDAWGL